MARKAKPWYWEERQAYYVTIHGSRTTSAPTRRKPTGFSTS